MVVTTSTVELLDWSEVLEAVEVGSEVVVASLVAVAEVDEGSVEEAVSELEVEEVEDVEDSSVVVGVALDSAVVEDSLSEEEEDVDVAASEEESAVMEGVASELTRSPVSKKPWPAVTATWDRE